MNVEDIAIQEDSAQSNVSTSQESSARYKNVTPDRPTDDSNNALSLHTKVYDKAAPSPSTDNQSAQNLHRNNPYHSNFYDIHTAINPLVAACSPIVSLLSDIKLK